MLLIASLSLAACDLVFPLNAPSGGGPSGCPPAYTPRSAGTYRLVTATTSWDVAVEVCKTDQAGVHGGNLHTHLVVLSDNAEFADVLGLAGSSMFWIGLHDQQVPLEFHWVSTEDAMLAGVYPPPNGSPWLGGEPNNNNDNERCVDISMNAFDDEVCSVPLAYVCECDAFEAR